MGDDLEKRIQLIAGLREEFEKEFKMENAFKIAYQGFSRVCGWRYNIMRIRTCSIYMHSKFLHGFRLRRQLCLPKGGGYCGCWYILGNVESEPRY